MSAGVSVLAATAFYLSKSGHAKKWLAETGSSSFPKAGVQLDDGTTAESVADLDSE
ncbi:hypothetical protein [Sulfuricella sp.]|uniref:hypothetical protein n=1 Tax=Sulfuricella sp. TaxID=2099377 RepID=UPI002BEB506C|nr:hypothetical protein [Sulfuricella sp.]HUX62655.1 hypothetical protein [Sulfuricella sp.]